MTCSSTPSIGAGALAARPHAFISAHVSRAQRPHASQREPATPPACHPCSRHRASALNLASTSPLPQELSSGPCVRLAEAARAAPRVGVHRGVGPQCRRDDPKLIFRLGHPGAPCGRHATGKARQAWTGAVGRACRVPWVTGPRRNPRRPLSPLLNRTSCPHLPRTRSTERHARSITSQNPPQHASRAGALHVPVMCTACAPRHQLRPPAAPRCLSTFACSTFRLGASSTPSRARCTT